MSAARFVEVLAQQCKLDAREIADLLWLVVHPPVAERVATEPIAERAAEDDEPKVEHRSSEDDSALPPPVPSPESPLVDRRQDEADLAIAPPHGQLPAGTLPIRVPDPNILTETLPLVRALRPLLQQVESDRAGGINEVETVHRIAETDVWSPVLEFDREPWFEVAIAIDVSPSMTLWRRLLDELRRLLACYGGFRHLRVWELQPTERGVLLRSPSSGALLDPSVLRSADRRRLTIVFSDCTADYWWDGRMQPVLRRWGETMPVAIWQMLPDWMWSQAALGLGEYVTLRNAKRGATNAQLVPKFLSLRPFARVRRDVEDADRVPPTVSVPVVMTQADSLAGWARLVAGDRQSGVPGFVLPSVGWQPRDPEPDLEVDERLTRFMRRSSPEARRLLALLSAAPVVTLPVMRLIRASDLFEASTPQPIAEVFLSGMLERQPRAEGDDEPSDPEQVQYEFRGELRDRFLEVLPKADGREVFEAVSAHVAERLGRTVTDFKALLVSPGLRDERDRLGLRSFASVAARVLRQLGPEYAAFARQLEGAEPPAEPEGSAIAIALEEFESDVAVFERDDGPQFEAFEWESVETLAVLKRFEFETAQIAIVERQPVITRSRASNWGYTETLGDEVGLDMMLIPAGTFRMGSPDSEREGPQHEVSVPDFFMGRFAVTQAQWRAVAGYPPINRDLDPDPSRFKGSNCPVEQVSWDDAQEFCQRLSARTGREYRLPSEAEWEYGCRAGTVTSFHFGDLISTDLANYNGNHTYNNSSKGEYRKRTVEVGRFPANRFGLYDVHGNVWEWCEDNWHGSYEGAPTDGSAWVKENRTENNRLLRGGSWYYIPEKCRSAFRGLGTRDFRFVDVGFRVSCASPSAL